MKSGRVVIVHKLALAVASIALAGMAQLSARPALADAPASTRPSHMGHEHEPRNIRSALHAAMGPRFQGPVTYTPQEWSQMMDFLKVNSPSRYLVLVSNPLEENSAIKQDLIRKWRNYNFVKDHFPPAADFILKRIHTEDEVFALVLQAKSVYPTDVDEYESLIRSKESNLVQLGFDEQQMRIDKLEQLLSEDKARLASSEANRDEQIDQRTERVMSEIRKHAGAMSKPSSNNGGSDVFANENAPGTASPVHVKIGSMTTTQPDDDDSK